MLGLGRCGDIPLLRQPGYVAEHWSVTYDQIAYWNNCLRTFPCHGLSKVIKVQNDFTTVEL